MKTKRFRRVTALLCALALTLSLAPAAFAAGSPAVSDNSMTSGYGEKLNNWAKPVTSYLFENPQGNLTRVEYIAVQDWSMSGLTISMEETKTIVVEDYTPDFQLISSRTIPMELDIWGGFFAGEKYNFFIFGQNNPEESDSVEVIRIVKYDKNWNRLGQASLYGANTYAPISASAVDCAEYGDVLYIRTAYEAYKTPDGKNHQSNMTIILQESTMTIPNPPREADLFYISHSFKQLILIDSDGNIITADHGDAGPRAFRLLKYRVKAGSLKLKSTPPGVFSGDDFPYIVDFQTFPGKAGENTTDGKLQGLEEVSGGYVVTYIYKNNVYLAYVAKQDFVGEHFDDGTARLTQITSYRDDIKSAGLAYGAAMVSTGLSGGYVIWAEAASWGVHPSRLFYASYSADGSIGPIQEFAEGRLSDCQPIVYRGKVVWYQTEDSVPTFYTLDASGATVIKANGMPQSSAPAAPSQPVPSAPETPAQPGIPKRPATASAASLPFADVAANSPYRDAIAWAMEWNITNGTSENTFSPNAPCTEGQIITFLYRAAGSPNKGSSEWASAVKWADNYYITYASRDTPCTRMNAMIYLWLAHRKPDSSANISFADINENNPAIGAVRWAVEQGITTGTSQNTFSPQDICTRGQIVTFLYRALAL